MMSVSVSTGSTSGTAKVTMSRVSTSTTPFS